MKKLIKNLAVFLLAASLMIPSYASNLEEAKDKKEEIEDQIQNAKSDREKAVERLEELSLSMKQTGEDLDRKKGQIEAAEQELIMAKIEEDTQYESMKLRIQYMYENGNVSLIEIFLESDSISDFLSKAEYMIMMSKYDRERLQDFQHAVQKVEEKEYLLQEEYRELEEIQASLAIQREEAQSLLASIDQELEDLAIELVDIKNQIKIAEEAERKKKEAEEAERKRKEAEEAEKKRQEEEAKNQQNNNSSSNSSGSQTKPPVVNGSGYFTHPCPGMSYQSSYFGEVRYGIGDTRPHSGHDYAAAEGTPIYAAAAGKVITAGYSYSAGYWVVINHGNGLTTKYMHMYEMPYVSAGDTVVKGQHIGGVGTTGQSTGNHLHFQVEENGIPVNPDKYL